MKTTTTTRIFVLGMVLAGCVFSASAFAGDNPSRKTAGEESRKYTRRYGMAGCGIGSLILTKNDVPQQLGVWAINFGLGHYVSSFFNPTWSMSSGTSNCTDAPAQAAMEQEVFVTANYGSLSKEAASGAGQHLDGLAEVFGCDDKVGFALFSQSRFERLYGSSNPKETLERYRAEIGSSGIGQCTRVPSAVI